MTSAVPVIGRFAPSPTGPLHAGSLVAALGSCLSARAQNGRWLLRMDDLDTQRCSTEHASTILRQLEWLGFEWEGAMVWQSSRLPAYRAALAQLRDNSLVYPCHCSRREWVSAGDGLAYPGTCRGRSLPFDDGHSLRLKVNNTPICFDDRRYGIQCQPLDKQGGDFVVLRADGYFAYQLATVVDDADSGITEIVRGADLLDSTFRQVYLQQLLNVPTPAYLHLPVVFNTAGQKLSKQTLAPAIIQHHALAELKRAMRRLGHAVPAEVNGVADFWSWAPDAWQEARLPPP